MAVPAWDSGEKRFRLGQTYEKVHPFGALIRWKAYRMAFVSVDPDAIGNNPRAKNFHWLWRARPLLCTIVSVIALIVWPAGIN